MSIPGLTETQFNLIKQLLPKDLKVVLFGSRATNQFRKNSDLDLCIISSLSKVQVSDIKEKLEESNFPFTVDLILYEDCDDNFKKIIDKTGIFL